MSKTIELAVEWISRNVKVFRNDFSTVEKAFPSLTGEEKKQLKVIHKKGLREWDEENLSVKGQDSTDADTQRSYGW